MDSKMYATVQIILMTNIADMPPTKQEKQVVSKKRVADHGEVYTASREVNAMLDLVKQETERIESRNLLRASLPLCI